MPYCSLSWSRLETLLRIYPFFLIINLLHCFISSTEMYLGFRHRNVRKIKVMIQKSPEKCRGLAVPPVLPPSTYRDTNSPQKWKQWSVQTPWGKNKPSNSLQKYRGPFWGWVNGKQGQKWYSFIHYKVSEHFSHALCTDYIKMAMKF